MKAQRIAVFGMYGQLNMGNECTLQALLLNLRKWLPEAEAYCICPEPLDVLTRHNVRAVQMSIGAGPDLGWRALNRLLAKVRPLKTRVRAFRWAYSKLRGTEMLLVAGTGIFEENIGLSRGWLFDLLTWCIAARMRRCYLAFVSIGAGPLHTIRARWVIKVVLRLANYVSYRDRYSADYMASVGLATREHFIFPDLAFSLPGPLLNWCSASRDPRKVVGVGIMDYFGQRKENIRADADYFAYLEKITAFICWLVSRGYHVKILGGDARYDEKVVIDVKAKLAKCNLCVDGKHVSEATFSTVEDVIMHIGSVSVVVAARFHNLVLALMLRKPTLSISYHEKNEELLNSFGLHEFSQNIDELDEVVLERQFLGLTESWNRRQPRVNERLLEFRIRLDDQYRTLFS